MPDYRVISTETISGYGESDTASDAIRATITAYPPGQGSVGDSPPRRLGLGQIGFHSGDYRATGVPLQWDAQVEPVGELVSSGAWWQLIPGVEATLDYLALIPDSALDTATLGYTGQPAGCGRTLTLT